MSFRVRQTANEQAPHQVPNADIEGDVVIGQLGFSDQGQEGRRGAGRTTGRESEGLPAHRWVSLPRPEELTGSAQREARATASWPMQTPGLV